MRHVPSRLDEAIDDLRANFEDAADPDIEGQKVLASLPIDNKLRLGSYEPSPAELIGNERLKNQCIRRGPSGISRE